MSATRIRAHRVRVIVTVDRSFLWRVDKMARLLGRSRSEVLAASAMCGFEGDDFLDFLELRRDQWEAASAALASARENRNADFAEFLQLHSKPRAK